MSRFRAPLVFALLISQLPACGSPPKKTPDPEPEHPTDFDVIPGGAVTAVSAVVHEKVKTLLVIRWTQSRDTLSTRVVYTFENDEWHETSPEPKPAGAHETVLLGIPEQSAVTFYIETEIDVTAMDAGALDGGVPDGGVPDGIEESERFTVHNGKLPDSLPRPTVRIFHPELASNAQWLVGSVEDTPSASRYYDGPFWIFIMDREGRIVWYYVDQAFKPTMAYPRVARDSSHLYLEKRMFHSGSGYSPSVVRLTLDHRFFEAIPLPRLDDCFDVTDDGAILFNEWSRGETARLMERRPSGEFREIWDCRAWAESAGVLKSTDHYCYSNTVNWNPADDTVLMSMPYLNTAVEIDRQTGRLVSQWGDAAGSFDFSPSSWSFEFNHYPNITKDGTLLISTHAPGHEDKDVVGEHRFVEFDIDRDAERLVEKWVYGAGIDEWPKYKGEAHRLENGNTLVNYGTGGMIREVTPDKETVWHVKFDADFEDDHFNKMVGHTFFVEDLYALCRGW